MQPKNHLENYNPSETETHTDEFLTDIHRYDLEEYIHSTPGVSRYISDKKPYPEGFIEDNLFNHIKRGYSLLKEILPHTNPKEIDGEYAILMWLLHDLGELAFEHDECAPDNPKTTDREENLLTHIIEESSKENKDEILRKHLYMNYAHAASFLKGEGFLPNDITPDFMTGLLVRTVDLIDGNMLFHQKLYEWIKQGNELNEGHPGGGHTFKQREIFFKQLEKLEDSETNELIKNLLDSQIDFVKNIWEGEEDRMYESIPELVEFS